jgi:hypothetical protein
MAWADHDEVVSVPHETSSKVATIDALPEVPVQ